MKCRVDKMSSWQNVKLTKCRVDKMSSWQNVKLTKCWVDKMLSRWNVTVPNVFICLARDQIQNRKRTAKSDSFHRARKWYLALIIFRKSVLFNKWLQVDEPFNNKLEMVEIRAGCVCETGSAETRPLKDWNMNHFKTGSNKLDRQGPILQNFLRP
jgi:hypothetical protein